jgi:hypothetical protein
MEVATETNCLEMGLVIVIFSLLLSFISSSSYHHLNAIELLTTDKFLLRLTKYSINISITLIHLAKRHYRFFIVNKILIVLAQTFINVSGTIMLCLNNFLGKII